jgi:hypothetical protein
MIQEVDIPCLYSYVLETDAGSFHVQGLVNHSEEDVTGIMGGLYGLIDGNQYDILECDTQGKRQHVDLLLGIIRQQSQVNEQLTSELGKAKKQKVAILEELEVALTEPSAVERSQHEFTLKNVKHLEMLHKLGLTDHSVVLCELSKKSTKFIGPPYNGVCAHTKNPLISSNSLYPGKLDPHRMPCHEKRIRNGYVEPGDCNTRKRGATCYSYCFCGNNTSTKNSKEKYYHKLCWRDHVNSLRLKCMEANPEEFADQLLEYDQLFYELNQQFDDFNPGESSALESEIADQDNDDDGDDDCDEEDDGEFCLTGEDGTDFVMSQEEEDEFVTVFTSVDDISAAADVMGSLRRNEL